MKIAYITGDISFNGNFSFFHDLLANYPPPSDHWHHRVYLISPSWDRGLVAHLKERGIEVRACFEDFQPTTDVYWEKIRQDTADCDVIISGNITNLDDVIPDSVKIPIVSVSLAQIGYRSPTGAYGTFYKPRFHKAAVSRAAVEAFPEHVREQVQVIYSGVDPGRLAQKVQRQEVRNTWFPGRSDDLKLILFMGVHSASKGLERAISSLEHLPNNYRLIVLSAPRDLKVPEHLQTRVSLCPPSFFVGDLYKACDCFLLPTEHEGFSMALLEAWYLETPVVTTKHKSMMELVARHPDVDFGTLLELEATPKEMAEAILSSKKSESATQCIYQNYMASNMVEGWQAYLEKLIERPKDG